MRSATAYSFSPGALAALNAGLDEYRERIILRPQEISNHPEVVRRLGCLAINGMIETDIYGNVNSSHVMGASTPERHRRLGGFRKERLPARSSWRPRR